MFTEFTGLQTLLSRPSFRNMPSRPTFQTLASRLKNSSPNIISTSGADLGFSVGGGLDPFLGWHGPPTRCFLVKMYVKMKELGPVGGVHRKILYVDPPMYIVI